MLEEAVEVMRALWTGEVVRAHHGRHYTVEHARLFTLPDAPPPVIVSGFGPQSVELAGRIGDGFMNVAPDADSVEQFGAAGGAGKPCYGKLDTCVAQDDATARRIAFETWPTSALEGEIGQELATPEHYEQAAATVTEEHVAEGILCSNEAKQHIDAIAEYADAGFDHVVVQQCGDDQDRFIALYADEVLPELTAPMSRPPA
jgi:G6PDH family F420-dependent oxidoreductase